MTVFDLTAFIMLPLLPFLLSPRQGSGTPAQKCTLKKGRSLPRRQGCLSAAHLFNFPVKEVDRIKWGLFFSLADKWACLKENSAYPNS